MIDIQKFIDKDYQTEDRVSRRKGVGSTQEFFTPFSIVERMASKFSDTDWADPSKTFLEPSFGNGNFVIYIVWKRITSGVSWRDTLSTLYGVELMADNVAECKERVLELLDKMGVEYDRDVAMLIMDKNLVCSDFFEWDFERWRSVKEEPLF